jgi:hypothetical protein
MINQDTVSLRKALTEQIGVWRKEASSANVSAKEHALTGSYHSALSEAKMAGQFQMMADACAKILQSHLPDEPVPGDRIELAPGLCIRRLSAGSWRVEPDIPENAGQSFRRTPPIAGKANEVSGKIQYATKPPGFDFGVALAALKRGSRVARRLWGDNPKPIQLMPGPSEIPTSSTLGSEVCFMMDGIKWQPSTTDLVAEDWFTLPRH